MKTIFALSLLLVLGIGWVSGVHATQSTNISPAAIHNRNADGAFRDGLYLGRLAAQRGVQPHITAGRWSTPQDRASFTAGYQTGYAGMLNQ
jgi:hypothetical protein